MSAAIQHPEPEDSYGGTGEYYDEDEAEYEEEYVEESGYFEEQEYDEVVDEVDYEEEYVEEVEYAEEEEEPQGGGLAAMIAAAASKRQDRIDQGDFQVTEQQNYNNEYQDDGDDDDAPQGGMAAMIAAAALKRKDRLDQGGEKKVTHVEKAPNEGMDMAAMIAKKANARNDRIEAGGELKVRVIPKAHKNVFVDVALEAARVGTLTRLNEHTVEAVAVGKEEEVWGGPSGLRTDHLRSVMFMAVNEAAALGAMKMKKATEVTNYDQNAYVEDYEPEDVDKMTDEHGRRVVRQLYLIDRKIAEERKYKKEEWSAENAANIVQYKSMDEVALPSATAPKWRPKPTNKTQRELMDAISNGVAERAWERNYRLNRPKANLQVTRKCNCKFCLNPNPYQTHKYKQMEEAGIKKSDGPILEKKDEKKKNANDWNANVKQTRTIKPGEWSEAQSTVTPLPPPTPVRKFQVKRPPPKPLADSGPEPSKVAPEPVQMEQEDDGGGEPGITVLLDETTTWGHKREKTAKPKKEKTKKTKKKSKKKGGGGCSIM